MSALWGAIAVVRQAAWFTSARALIYGRMFAATMLIIVVAQAGRIAVQAAADPQSRPDVTDFVAFWAAGRMALSGDAASAYDKAAITAVERNTVRIDGPAYLPFVYPALFLFLCAALATLPYLGAMAVFLLGGAAVVFGCLRRILPQGWAVLPILAFPGTVMSTIIGQNGCLTASCFAAAAVTLERRPALGGALLGLLAYKPQFAIGVPLALAAARRWRGFFSCGATAFGLCGLSWAVFGTGPWIAFLHAPALELAQLTSQPDLAAKLVSVFGAVRLLHGAAWIAYAVQGASCCVALYGVAVVASRRPGAGAELSACVVAALLVTPHAMDYDLACLGLPLAWLLGEATRTGWLPWEKTVLLAAYLVPLLTRWLSLHAHLPLTPFAVAGLFAVLAARVKRGALPASRARAA